VLLRDIFDMINAYQYPERAFDMEKRWRRWWG
jgi:hypothetical protein